MKDTSIANDFPINNESLRNTFPMNIKLMKKNINRKHKLILNKSFKVPFVKEFSGILKRKLQKEGIHVIFSK